MPDSAPLRPPARAIPSARGAALLVYAVLAAGLLVAFSRLGLATSTETRYAEIGREMRESGDAVVPTFNGAPHLEKPPFAYWGIALAFLMAGVNDVAARLPSLLAGLLTLLVVAKAARRLAPPDEPDPVRRGRSASLVLATCPAFLLQAMVVSTDAWLVLSMALAGWALLEADRAGGRPRRRWVLLLHAAFGFGMLVKGPITLVFTLAAAIATVAVRWIATKRLDARLLLPFVHPLGLLLFAAISLPWFLLAEARLPGTIDLYTSGRLAGKLAAGAGGHEQGPLVVWLAPLLGTWPWLGSLPAAISRLRRSGLWVRGPGLLLLALALVSPVLTSIRPGRLPSYSSPAIPFLALLVALGAPVVAKKDDPAAGPWLRGLFAGTLGLALAVAAGFAFALHERGFDAWVAGLAVAAAIALLAALVPWRALRPAVRAVPVVACALAAVALAGLGEPRRIDAHRPLWDEIAPRVRPDDRFAVHLGTGSTRVEGDWGMLPFYARRPVVFFGYPARLSVRPPAEDAPEFFRPDSEVTSWFRGPGRRWLFLPSKYVASSLGDAPFTVAATDGSYSIVVNELR